MPQGSALGPIIFLVFINDLPSSIKSNTRMFADDCIVYREINDPKDCKILQEDLDRLAFWERTWGMSFHPEKCSIPRVYRMKSPILSDYTLKGHKLATEDAAEYLRVEVSKDLSWKCHIDRRRKGTSHLVFCSATFESATRKSKIRHTSRLYDLTLSST